MSPAASGLKLRAARTADRARGGGPTCTIHVSRVEARTLTEIHLCAAPATAEGDFAFQASSVYSELIAELRSWGASPHDIVSEKVFLSDVGEQRDALRRIRDGFDARDATGRRGAPALTFVEQPPAVPGRLCEVQATVVLPAHRAGLSATSVAGLEGGASGKVLLTGDGVRHLYLSNVTAGPDREAGFGAEAAECFARADAVLLREGFTFRDVVRTWIYITNIERDYAALNRARRGFFLSRGVRPVPASTGIQGSIAPGDRGCGLDLRAVAASSRVHRSILHATTMNEAPSYGADFSRGMRVDFPDHTVIYLSGTASIDTRGRVVAPGEIDGQVDRMLENVEHLLHGQGAGYGNVVSAVTYLKRAEFLEPFQRVAARRGFPPLVPNTMCVADVCRPEWLCEIEAIAMIA